MAMSVEQKESRRINRALMKARTALSVAKLYGDDSPEVLRLKCKIMKLINEKDKHSV